MRYDFLEQLEVESVKEDNVVYGADNSVATQKDAGEKRRKVSVFNILVVQLAICIVVGLTFIALQLWTDVQVSRIGEIIMEAFNKTNTFSLGI